MDRFAQLAGDDRRVLFEETAARRGFSSTVVVEKDFWVCWTLKHLFALEGLPDLLFKGGTSLSKGFGLIERFSEDIDIAIDRAGLGFGGSRDPATLSSRKQREKATASLTEACSALVRGRILHALDQAFGSTLREPFELRIEETVKNPCDVVFDYPAALTEVDYGVAAYVPKVVRIEFGARSDHEPVEHADVRSFVAEAFPERFEAPSTAVRILAAERTFWEKATLFHAENGRPVTSSIPRQWARLSRHAYDLHQMSRRGVADKALQRLELLGLVAQHKEAFFFSRWAAYPRARPGTLRLAPRGPLREALREDYRQMRDMFAGDPPEFDEILAELEELESRINGGQAS